MTVSKVLRDAPDISAATKIKIRQLAEQMGYVPDTMAQSLRTRTTKLFGLVIPAATNQNFARVIMAIEEQAYELGFDVILAHTLNDERREETVIRKLLARRVHGLFIVPVYRLAPEVPIYKELAERKVPTIILGHRAPFCGHFPAVESDDLTGSYQLTQHLIQEGHRRIAYLSGPVYAPAATERIEGYRRALREAHIFPDDRLVYSAGNTLEEGEAVARLLLKERPDITAIQAFNDTVAVGVCSVLKKEGIRIPEDISVVGFGNILLAEYGCVPLTTARQPKQRMGRAAVGMMTKLLASQQVDTQRLPTPIIARSSTATPPPTPVFQRNAEPPTEAAPDQE